MGGPPSWFLLYLPGLDASGAGGAWGRWGGVRCEPSFPWHFPTRCCFSGSASSLAWTLVTTTGHTRWGWRGPGAGGSARHPPRPGQATLLSKSWGWVCYGPGALLPDLPLTSVRPGLGPGGWCPARSCVEVWPPGPPGGAASVTLFSRFVPAVVKQCSVKAWISLKPTPNSAKKTGIHPAHPSPAPQPRR